MHFIVMKKNAYWSTSWKNIFHMCRKGRRSIAILLWNTFANGNFQVKVKCTFYMFHFLNMMDSTNELAFKNLWPVKILQECLVFVPFKFLSLFNLIIAEIQSFFHISFFKFNGTLVVLIERINIQSQFLMKKV